MTTIKVLLRSSGGPLEAMSGASSLPGQRSSTSISRPSTTAKTTEISNFTSRNCQDSPASHIEEPFTMRRRNSSRPDGLNVPIRVGSIGIRTRIASQGSTMRCCRYLVNSKKSAYKEQLERLQLSHIDTTKAVLQAAAVSAPRLVVSYRHFSCLTEALDNDLQPIRIRPQSPLFHQACRIEHRITKALTNGSSIWGERGLDGPGLCSNCAQIGRFS